MRVQVDGRVLFCSSYHRRPRGKLFRRLRRNPMLFLPMTFRRPAT